MKSSDRKYAWLHEPLLHFLLIGIALFSLFHATGQRVSISDRIVVSKGRIDALAAMFARTRQRPPNAGELKGLVDDYVREELATREAITFGLDRDDTIIRRRLRQKLEFVIEDRADIEPPSEAELDDWLARHPDTYRREDSAAFRHVYLSPERRPDSIADDAAVLLSNLSSAGGDVDIGRMGDASLLPAEMPVVGRSAIAREFGDAFADGVLALETGRWLGPVESAFGLHLVFVVERKDGYVPLLSEVRSAVARDFTADRRTRQVDTMYEQLLSRYDVVVEWEGGAGGDEASLR